VKQSSGKIYEIVHVLFAVKGIASFEHFERKKYYKSKSNGNRMCAGSEVK
jgi:hypothetical protein